MLSRLDSMDDDADETDWALDALGLEMEPILRHHDSFNHSASNLSPRNGSRAAPIRTASGTLLYARAGAKQASVFMNQVCESRSRLVSSVNVSPRSRGSVLRTLGFTRRMSVFLIPLGFLMLYSVTFNLWEYLSYSGDPMDTATDDIATTKQDVVHRISLAPQKSPSAHSMPRPSLQSMKDASPSPTALQLPPPEDNEEEGTGMLYANSSSSTWLDWEDDLPIPKKPRPLAAGSGKAFVEQWCNVRGTTWYPTNTTARKGAAGGKSEALWQLRAPLFLLPGAAYSGTVYMASLLHQHPQILPARTKELQFFHDRPFRPYLDPVTEKTHVHAARQRMFARDYDVAQLKRNASLVSFDATPGYLYYSTVLPRRILCVEPWVKLVVLLRNPVDRILEHYAALRRKGSRGALEDYIAEELALMHQVGLLNASSVGPSFYGSAAEDLAWYDYQTASASGLLGRSLYVVQIRHWIATFRTAGRPAALLVLPTEGWAAEPQRGYDRILEFLHLAPYTIPKTGHLVLPETLRPSTRPVANATRQQLETFFRPYNRQLKVLLRQYGILG